MNSLLENKENKTVIEKSKFFSFSYTCKSLSEQTEILKQIKRQNLSATHVCYGSVIFQNNDLLYYSSDDREPSGTAGLQIVQALKENNMINTLCVVVRYFGGIKLGVAGLGRAYKESALSVILNNVKPVKLRKKYKLTSDYNKYENLKKYLLNNNLIINDVQFNNLVSLVTFLDESEKKHIVNLGCEVLDCKEEMYC